MKPKNNTYYFSHDCNAQTDTKLIRVRKELGWAGYGLFWALIERLRSEENYHLPYEPDILAYDLRTEEKIMESLIGDFGLFEVDRDSGQFYSPSLIRRMGVFDEKSEHISKVRSEAAKKANVKRWKEKKPDTSGGENTDLSNMLQRLSHTIQRKNVQSKTDAECGVEFGSQNISYESKKSNRPKGSTNDLQSLTNATLSFTTTSQTDAIDSHSVAKEPKPSTNTSQEDAHKSNDSANVGNNVSTDNDGISNDSKTPTKTNKPPTKSNKTLTNKDRGLANDEQVLANHRNLSQTDHKTSQSIAYKNRLEYTRIYPEEGVIGGGDCPPGPLKRPLPPFHEKNEDKDALESSEPWIVCPIDSGTIVSDEEDAMCPIRSESSNSADLPNEVTLSSTKARKEKRGLTEDKPRMQTIAEGKDALFDDIIHYWNERTSVSLGRLDGLTKSQKRNICNRIADSSPEAFFQMIDKVAASSYCRGNNQSGWTAYFDFCLRPTKYTKILSGCYDDESRLAVQQEKKKRVTQTDQVKHDNSENERSERRYLSVADYLDHSGHRARY